MSVYKLSPIITLSSSFIPIFSIKYYKTKEFGLPITSDSLLELTSILFTILPHPGILYPIIIVALSGLVEKNFKPFCTYNESKQSFL
jgi:hypothetical protein